MPNYKDTKNKVHFIESSHFEYLLPAGCIPITDIEAESLVPSIISISPGKQIMEIEQQTLMNRAVREFMLLSAETAAAAQGITPEQLYIANIAYKKVKDIDNQIAVLRSQL